MESGEEKRGRGRPRTVPEGRGGTLTITINPHTRADLEKASAQLGRSLSQTAEYAIERGKLLGELGVAGPAVADALQDMLRAANTTRGILGDPTASIEARDDLRARWQEIAKRALPNVEPAPAGVQAAQAAVSAMRFAAMDAYAAYACDLPDETLDPIERHLRRLSLAQLYPGLPDWDAAKAALETAAASADEEIASSIRALLAIATGAEHMVKRAEDKR